MLIRRINLFSVVYEYVGFNRKENKYAEAFDVSLTGFDEKELADLFKSDETDAEDDDFDLSEALEKASFVEKGDVWSVGRHRLVCGDATSLDDVAKLMDGKKANLLLTDPPYGVSFKSASGLTIQNDSIPAWVKAKNWYVRSVSGDRIVIDKSEDGKNAICSPVNASDLQLVNTIPEKTVDELAKAPTKVR